MKAVLVALALLVLGIAAALIGRGGESAAFPRNDLAADGGAPSEVFAEPASLPVIVVPFRESVAVEVPGTSLPEALFHCSLHQPDAFDLSGVLVDPAGRPVHVEFEVIFVPEGGSVKTATQHTRTVVGSFAFKEIAADSGTLVAISYFPHAWIQVRTVPARRGDEGVRIEVDRGSALAGRVHCEKDGFETGELRARVRHHTAPSIQEGEGNFEFVVELKSDGTFCFPPILKGFVDVEILQMPIEHVLAKVEGVRVPGGEPVADGRLTPIFLDSPVGIVIDLVGSQGEPVIEATLKSRSKAFVSSARPFDANRYYGLEPSSNEPASKDAPATHASISWNLRVPASGFAGVVIAPGYVPKEVWLDRSQVIMLDRAPMLTATLAPNLRLSSQVFDQTSQFDIQVILIPEDAALRTGSADLAMAWFDTVSLIGALDLRRGERSFRIPTVGAGRYRLEARIHSRRGFG